MEVGKQLTEVQSKILAFMPSEGLIRLRQLANKMEMSSNQVRVHVRQLESLGYVSVSPLRWPTDPLKILLLCMAGQARPNFDKLLINTKWV